MTARNTRPAQEPQTTPAPVRAQRVAHVQASTIYRVAALPSYATESDDVILSDALGHTYLLSGQQLEPSPLERAEADALGMFFEPSQDSSWHTLSELRTLIYGGAAAGS